MDTNVLILGGTGEARRLAERLVQHGGLRIVLSLAGRTAEPLAQAAEVRIGGFGGATGLARHIREHRVDILVDATHPFAARISENAGVAAEETGVPLVVLKRPAWKPVPGDLWIEAGSIAEAAGMLGERPRNVFLAIGRQELGPFARQGQHSYLVRSVDPVDPTEAPAGASFILDRGPFPEEAERALLAKHRIDIVVAKNSGGAATYGKIAAARALGLPVIIVRRPRPAATDAVSTVDEAFAAVLHCSGLTAERGE